MSKLEEKQLDSITSVDINALVGREENQRLEFKETIDGINSYELAKDLASFANVENGYIVVGAVQDKTTEKCVGFRSVQNVKGSLNKIRDVGVTHIDKPLALEPVARDASTGESLVLVRIPRSVKLRAVITNHKAEYWKRFGTSKREMMPGEIETVMRESQVAEEEEAKHQLRLVNYPTRWNEITDPHLLGEVMDKRFHERTGSERYLRISSTPLELKQDRVNTGNNNLRAFIQFPSFGQRDDGWCLGMGAGERQVLPTPLGFESRPSGNGSAPPLILLTRSGHFEFWVPLFPLICFQQTAENFRARPRLWPTAVVEFPLSFLRFVKELYQQIGVSGSLIARTEYRNLLGCILYAGLPYGTPFFDGPYPFTERHYGPYEQRLQADFDPDAAALSFALHFYRAFGYDRKHIPYFPNEKFTLPPRGQT